MDNKNYVTVIDQNGIPKQVEVLNYVNLTSNGKDYVIFTENQLDSNGNTIICAAEAVEKADGSFEFANIYEQNILDEIRNVIIDLSKEG